MKNRIDRLPPGAMAFSPNIPEQVTINTGRIGVIEKDLYDKDTGIKIIIGNHEKDIDFFKRFIKFASWGIGIVMAILITIFGLVAKINIDLVKDVATLMAKLGGG